MPEAKICGEGHTTYEEELGVYGDELGTDILCEHVYSLAQDLSILDASEQCNELRNDDASCLEMSEPEQKEVLLASSCSETVYNNSTGGRFISCKTMASRFNTSDNVKLSILSNLSDATSMELNITLLTEKLRQCGVLFDFQNLLSDIESKDIKRADLEDILLFINENPNSIPISMYSDFITMIKKNLMVPLCPPSFIMSDSIDLSEGFAIREPAWYHLELVYKILITFLETPYIATDILSELIDMDFIVQLFDLLSSEDPNERELLTKLIYSMYFSLFNLRPSIRNVINNVLLQVIYENRIHNGICKILEIVGSIIYDIAFPLDQENLRFFKKVLIPLHKPQNLLQYYNYLSRCIILAIRKFPQLAEDALVGLLKYWPKTNSLKEIIYLCEVEEILKASDTINPKCLTIIFKQMAQCISSPNSRVSHRALMLCDNESVTRIILKNIDIILPELFTAIYEGTTNSIDDAE